MQNRDQAAGRVEELTARAKRCCCKFCGGHLIVRRIIFSEDEQARIELFCSQCDRIEYGVEPEIYSNAVCFVDHFHFNHYPDLDSNAQTRRMNIAKICDIMMWGDKRLGFLNQNGFQFPVQKQQMLADDILLLSKSARLEEASRHD